MKKLIEWLEIDKKRTRKVLALFTAVIWMVSVFISYWLYTMKFDTIAILSLVTAQFSSVIGFYMLSNAESD